MSVSATPSARIRQGVYGVLGHRISYSRSPLIFRCVFDDLGWPAVYAIFDLPPARLGRFLAAARDLPTIGLNVTRPYKIRICDHLDRLDPTAAAVGAVNTVVFQRGRLIGYNTDVNGVYAALRSQKRLLRQGAALVLGGGGAARAVAYALAHHLQMRSITFAVRSLARGRRIVTELARHMPTGCTLRYGHLAKPFLRETLDHCALLVNTTPVGGVLMQDQNPLPKGVALPRALTVFDVVYTPRPTRLVRAARQAGCRAAVDGWMMLVGQAEASFKLWTGRLFPLMTRRALFSEETDR